MAYERLRQRNVLCPDHIRPLPANLNDSFRIVFARPGGTSAFCLRRRFCGIDCRGEGSREHRTGSRTVTSEARGSTWNRGEPAPLFRFWVIRACFARITQPGRALRAFAEAQCRFPTRIRRKSPVPVLLKRSFIELRDRNGANRHLGRQARSRASYSDDVSAPQGLRAPREPHLNFLRLFYPRRLSPPHRREVPHPDRESGDALHGRL